MVEQFLVCCIEVPSSGTRCSCCKMVVVVTLGGCHLLDDVVACLLRRMMHRDCAVLRSEITLLRGVVLARGRSWRTTLVEVRCEEDLGGTPAYTRVPKLGTKLDLLIACRKVVVLKDLPQRGLSGWQTTKPWNKNHCVNLCILLSLQSLSLACSYLLLHVLVLLLCLFSLCR